MIFNNTRLTAEVDHTEILSLCSHLSIHCYILPSSDVIKHRSRICWVRLHRKVLRRRRRRRKAAVISVMLNE